MRIEILYIISLSILISVTNGNLPKKIDGGTKARIQDHPFVVSIQYRNNHICSGSIISKYHILTAASCLVHNNKNEIYGNLQIFSGTDNLMALKEDIVINDIEFVILHEEFNFKNQSNNIAILRLSKPLNFSRYCSAISLSDRKKISGERYMTGWGKNPSYMATNKLSRVNSHLRFINVKLYEPNYCMKMYNLINFSHYCLLPNEKNSYLTQGNGGSPITADADIFSSNKIVGIVSSISTSPFEPSTYTRIYEHLDWIEATMNYM